MRSTAKKEGFTLVEFTVTFETQEEVDAFYSILNTSGICDGVRKHLNLSDMRAPLSKYTVRSYVPDIVDAMEKYIR